MEYRFPTLRIYFVPRFVPRSCFGYPQNRDIFRHSNAGCKSTPPVPVSIKRWGNPFTLPDAYTPLAFQLTSQISGSWHPRLDDLKKDPRIFGGHQRRYRLTAHQPGCQIAAPGRMLTVVTQAMSRTAKLTTRRQTYCRRTHGRFNKRRALLTYLMFSLTARGKRRSSYPQV